MCAPKEIVDAIRNGRQDRRAAAAPNLNGNNNVNDDQLACSITSPLDLLVSVLLPVEFAECYRYFQFS